MKKIVILVIAITLSIFMFAGSVFAMEGLPHGATYTQVKERVDELIVRLRNVPVSELDDMRNVLRQYIGVDYAKDWSLSCFVVTFVKAEKGNPAAQLAIAKGDGDYEELCVVAEVEKETGKGWQYGGFLTPASDNRYRDTWKSVEKRHEYKSISESEKWYKTVVKNPKANFNQKRDALLSIAGLKITLATKWEQGSLSAEGELRRSIGLLNEAKQIASQVMQLSKQRKDRASYNTALSVVKEAETSMQNEIKLYKQRGAVKQFLQ